MTRSLFAWVLLAAAFAGCSQPSDPPPPTASAGSEDPAPGPDAGAFRFEGTMAAGFGVRDGGCESGAVVIQGTNAFHEVPVPKGTVLINATLEATGVAPPDLRLCAFTDGKTYSLTGVPPLTMEIPGEGVSKVRFQVLPNNMSPMPSARVAYALSGTLVGS